MFHLTDLMRVLLVRSFKPFVFTNEYDETVDYSDCDRLGLYIHIPFCRSVCGFCPYCKEKFEKQKYDRYIDALITEIHLKGSCHEGKKTVTGLYFGGGTPALATDRIMEIIDAVREHYIITEGIGIELHPDDVKPDVLMKLKDAGVTKISIGIQSFLDKYSSILHRPSVDPSSLADVLSRIRFETVSMDFIFALPGQTIDDLKYDLETAFEAGANHVAVYPFIDFSFANREISPMKKKEKRVLMDRMTDHFEKKGYIRKSIWTFANCREADYSSMSRETFLGFGCSAVTVLKDSFGINTFSVDEYCNRINQGKLPTALTLSFKQRQRMLYYLFWTAYSMKVDLKEFKRFFGVSLYKKFRFEVMVAKLLGYIKVKDDNLYLTKKGAYYFHYYENFYTLSYIDKMWGLLRNEAFPEKMTI
ncbi:MAG: radical SAM protein [Lachnospiraceae bacterium]|nr:radical SAM protein [Lachnospiraceae bacterium]